MDNFQRQRVSLKQLPPALLAKWSEKTLSEGFVPLPKKVVRCMHRIFQGDAGVTDLAALLAIVDYRRERMSRKPSRDFLAFVAGLTRGEFDQALDRLQAKQLIVVHDVGEGIDVEIWGLLQRVENETKESCA